MVSMVRACNSWPHSSSCAGCPCRGAHGVHVLMLQKTPVPIKPHYFQSARRAVHESVCILHTPTLFFFMRFSCIYRGCSIRICASACL